MLYKLSDPTGSCANKRLVEALKVTGFQSKILKKLAFWVDKHRKIKGQNIRLSPLSFPFFLTPPLTHKTFQQALFKLFLYQT